MNEEASKAREAQNNRDQLANELGLAEAKIKRMNLDHSSQNSSVEDRLKS